MFKYPVLIGLHRSGTAWVQQYIRSAYSSYGLTLSSNKDDEFLATHYNHVNTQTKIKLLETARANGLEVCAKHMVSDIIPIFFWFKEFYKNADIIILKRRNLWKTYISWLFHTTINLSAPQIALNPIQHPWHCIDPTAEDRLKSTIQTYNIQFTFNHNIWEGFIQDVRFLNNDIMQAFDSKQVLWLEDLTDEFLEDRFNSKPKAIIKPFKRLNYEVYYSTKELNFIKETYNERFNNEFQHYGYKH